MSTEFLLSIIGAVIAGIILLIIEYRTHWFAGHIEGRHSATPNIINFHLTIRSFVDDLILARQDPYITPQNLDRVRQSLLSEVHNAINTRLVRCLSHEDQVALDKLLDANSSNRVIDEFFIKKVPNIDAEIAEELLSFRTLYLVRPKQSDNRS